MTIHTLKRGLLVSLSAKDLEEHQLNAARLTTNDILSMLRTAFPTLPTNMTVESFANPEQVLLFLSFPTHLSSSITS